jgi:GntR family transcriptional regulator of arabinose operon
MAIQVVPTSKYQQIQEWIRESIESGRFRPGDKLPSESELCRQFDVSRNSVRQAIKILINQGWLESKKGIGTFCLLKTRQLTHDIGLICYYSGSYIFPRISTGCDQIAHRNGFHILLKQSEFDYEKERQILIELQKRGVDGIIISPYYSGNGLSNQDLLLAMEKSGTPVVLIDNYFPDSSFTRIAMDDRAGGRLVAQHLWEKGHRRIGILTDSDYYPKQMRKQGALEYLKEMGADIRAAQRLYLHERRREHRSVQSGGKTRVEDTRGSIGDQLRQFQPGRTAGYRPEFGGSSRTVHGGTIHTDHSRTHSKPRGGLSNHLVNPTQTDRTKLS